MNRTRFHCRTMLALFAIISMSLTPTAFAATGKSANIGAPDPDLSNEVRILGSYFDDLVALQNECAELQKKAVLLHIHINPLVRKSEDLKNRLSGVQQTVRDVITKLKAANLWEDFDRQIQARLTNPIVHTEPWARTLLQEESFKRLLEDNAANLSSHRDEISIPVDNLRKKIAGRNDAPNSDRTVAVVLVAYRPLNPGPYRGLTCEVGKVMTLAKIIDHRGIGADNATLNRVSCACGQSTACH